MENKKIEVENCSNARMEEIRFYCAQEILDNGGAELMKAIKHLKIMSQTSILSPKHCLRASKYF
jgi:hypothetical protein